MTEESKAIREKLATISEQEGYRAEFNTAVHYLAAEETFLRPGCTQFTQQGDAAEEDAEFAAFDAAALEEIEKEIEGLVDKIMLPDIDKTTVKYINERIAKLDSRKVELSRECDKLRADRQKRSETDFKVLHNVMDKWDELTFDDKRSVVELLIEKILVFPDRIEIQWKV